MNSLFKGMCDYTPTTASYELAKRCCFSATKYFSNNLNANQIRLRHPPDNIATFKNSSNHKYDEFKLTMHNPVEVKSHSGSYFLFFLHLFPQFIRNRKYKSIIHYAKSVFEKIPSYSLIPYFGYMATLCKSGLDDEEMEFVQKIENSYISYKDVPHFTHLLDELIVLQSFKFNPLLVSFMMLNLSDLSKNLFGNIHIVPVLNSGSHEFTSSNQVLNELYKRKMNAMRELPLLETTKEGIDVDINQMKFIDPSSEIISLIANQKWDEALICSSQRLSKRPNDPMFMVHHILSLYKIGKVFDAIDMCSHAYNLYQANVLLYIRAILWLSINETYYAKMDLIKIVDFDFVKDIFGINKINDSALQLDSIDTHVLISAVTSQLKGNRFAKQKYRILN